MLLMKSLYVLYDFYNEILDKMVYIVSYRLFILRRLNGYKFCLLDLFLRFILNKF